MNNNKIVYYLDEKGASPFQSWYERLDRLAARKVYLALMRMEAGNFSDSKHLKGGFWEKRIHWGPGYRLYYGLQLRGFVILLAGGTKKTQRADIETARRYWNEYKNPKG